MSYYNTCSIRSCKDCKDRVLGCHSKCEKYLNDKKKWEHEKEIIEKSKDKIANEYTNERIKEREKWRNRHKKG